MCATSLLPHSTNMACNNCARTTLTLFIRSFVEVRSAFPLRQATFSSAQHARFISTARQPFRPEGPVRRPFRPESPVPLSPKVAVDGILVEDAEEDSQPRYERPSWQAQKAALKEKLGGEAWNPRKKLSPDTMEGIRHLHRTTPDRFTTPVLANHFEVSPEAMRRILKGKWQPSTDEEYDDRMRRWDKRGERIWSNMVEMGVKPPKKWREMGVGRAPSGERPKWKGRRSLIDVRDSASNIPAVEEREIIPVVDGSGKSRSRPRPSVRLSNRL
jgi:hypothetical protein